jgi:antitoxin (DNA-binding transcriptional repressor) of toxin-antitoxin stability system
MSQIDLDDLPPKIAKMLGALRQGDEVVLVQGGAVVGRLSVADESVLTPPGEPIDGIAAEDHVAEIMGQFNAMIHDEF